MGSPDSSAGKESACNTEDPSSTPGLGRSPGEGISYPLQYSWASLVAQLVMNLPTMQETLVRFPGLGGSAGKGIGYSLQYSWASLVTQLAKNLPAMWETWFDLWVGKIPWRREQSTPVFWPGEFHGLYSLWGHKESDMTEQLSLSLS